MSPSIIKNNKAAGQDLLVKKSDNGSAKLGDEIVVRTTPKIIFRKPDFKRHQDAEAKRNIAGSASQYIKALQAEPLMITPPSSEHSDSELSNTKLEDETKAITPPGSELSDSELSIAELRSQYHEALTVSSSRDKAKRIIAESRSRYLEALEAEAHMFTLPTKLEDEITATSGTNDLTKATPSTSASEDVKLLINPKIILHAATFRWKKVGNNSYEKVNRVQKPKTKPRIIVVRRN